MTAATSTPASDRPDIEAISSSPRWMQAAGLIVFAAVLALLSWILPPLFDTGVPSGGGGHTPPAGGHGPPTSDGG